jgi:DNA-binding transcriptional ArsR family regulator
VSGPHYRRAGTDGEFQCFESTDYTRSNWDPQIQHGSPPLALMTKLGGRDRLPGDDQLAKATRPRQWVSGGMDEPAGAPGRLRGDDTGVLREVGLVEVRPDAQRRIYALRADGLVQIDEWIDRYRRYWAGHLDALERHLGSTRGDAK